MKLVDPISSALLITGCVYAAGTSQNNSFMREFGINPEFSQPSIEKTLYDGGIITFEIVYSHFVLLLTIALLIIAAGAITLIVKKITSRLNFLIPSTNSIAKIYITASKAPLGFLFLTYIMYLSFSSFQKGQDDGVKLAMTFIERCHWVEIKEKSETTKACAFRKDKDSIWYYQIESNGPKKNSKLLSSSTSVTYLEPEINILTKSK
jgi:hypothetical protein